MEATAKDVIKLRELTGAGPLDCKKALTEAKTFDEAVRLLEETGMDPADVDTCMQLGAGHPMGPLALLDLVGLDVSKAIGEPIPPRLGELIAAGHLGRKSGRGLHSY